MESRKRIIKNAYDLAIAVRYNICLSMGNNIHGKVKISDFQINFKNYLLFKIFNSTHKYLKKIINRNNGDERREKFIKKIKIEMYI